MLQSSIYVINLFVFDHWSNNDWWKGKEDVLNKILFKLAVNNTGILKKLNSNENINTMSHKDWVDSFMGALNVEKSFVKDWCEKTISIILKKQHISVAIK